MIELLGIGVSKGGRWRLRGVCARVENRTLAAVLSTRRDERVGLLDVIAGREIPSEGRAWIDGIPLSAETAGRIRRRVGVVDFAFPLVPGRSVAWNVSGVETRRRWRDLLGGSWRAALPVGDRALERVGLGAEADRPASELDAWGRIRLQVARALRRSPGYLVVVEPDTHLPVDDVVRLLGLLQTLVRRDGVSVFVTVADSGLVRGTGVVLHVGDRDPVLA